MYFPSARCTIASPLPHNLYNPSITHVSIYETAPSSPPNIGIINIKCSKGLRSCRKPSLQIYYFISMLMLLVHIQGYVQFWQSPILYYIMDKQIVFSTIVGYNLNEIHVHNCQMQYLTHCHWSVQDWLDIQYLVHLMNYDK
jgi:hypothetical protein